MGWRRNIGEEEVSKRIGGERKGKGETGKGGRHSSLEI